MGLWDRITGEFIDIIQWTEPSQNEILSYRFTRYKNEIKNGAKLIVREGQAAAFVREGQLADVKTPGTYTLDTQNMPILSTILGWKYWFESPFKITDPATFLKDLVATDPSFDAYEITGQFRNAIVSRFVDAIGNAKIPML